MVDHTAERGGWRPREARNAQDFPKGRSRSDPQKRSRTSGSEPRIRLHICGAPSGSARGPGGLEAWACPRAIGASWQASAAFTVADEPSIPVIWIASRRVTYPVDECKPSSLRRFDIDARTNRTKGAPAAP
jgi:hypothetical protein